MSTELSTVIRKIALSAVDAQKPCDIRYGQVVNDNPIAIKISDSFILNEKFLIIPEQFRNKMKTMTYVESYQNWETNTTEYTTQIQAYQSDTSLKVFDDVILLREQGGRRYVVIGRV